MIERKEKQYPIEDVFDFVNEHIDKKDRKKRVDFDGDQIKPFSVRYLTFIQKGTHCVSCGIEGAYFIKERNQSKKPKQYNPDEKYHFNLYALDEDGNEILLTKDHIIPKSIGGSDSVSNMVCMCTHCNGEKGKILPKKWQKDHPDAEQLPKGKMKPKKKRKPNEH